MFSRVPTKGPPFRRLAAQYVPQGKPLFVGRNRSAALNGSIRTAEEAYGISYKSQPPGQTVVLPAGGSGLCGMKTAHRCAENALSAIRFPKQQATLPPTAAGHCRNYKKLLLWLDVPSRSSWNSPPPRHMSVSRFQPLGTGQDAEECGPMICAAINKRGFSVRGPSDNQSKIRLWSSHNRRLSRRLA